MISRSKVNYIAEEIAPNIKGLIFGLSVAVLSIPIAKDAIAVWKEIKFLEILKSVLGAMLISAGVFILQSYIGLRSMGITYGLNSLSPFEQVASWYNTKLLMPAMAHIFFLREYWLYYIYFMGLTTFFITILILWLKKNTSVTFLHIYSICTSSFVIHQFQIPGYPDILVFIFFLLIMFNRLSQKSKLSLLVLALIAHESSIFVGLPLAGKYLTRRGRVFYMLVAFLYILTWSLAARGVWNISSSRDVGSASGITWVLQYPWRELFGILISYKLLWLLILSGLILSLRSGKYNDALFIVAVIGAGLLMTFLGIDTSRLLGFSFPALLLSLSVLKKEAKWSSWKYSAIYSLNFIIPSVSIGLYEGVVSTPGLYTRLYNLLAFVVGK